MNDQDMDDAFDFKGLTLDAPEERLQKAFEQSFHLSSQQAQESAAPPPPLSLTLSEDSKQGVAMENTHGQKAETTATPDNGPWAKIPSPSDVHPFQPGVTAEKLDAMAMDPNHVFKSAPAPFPFTVPPSTTTTTTTSTTTIATDATLGSDVSMVKTENEGATRSVIKENIPEWMLEDPELVAQIGWDIKDTSGPNFTSKDFTLDWANSSDISTMIDSNIMFGFSSYPTYETLPISSVIAEEHYRRSTGDAFNHPVSPTTTGDGFAKYGTGDGMGAVFFGHKSPTNESLLTDPGILWGEQSTTTTTTTTTVPSGLFSSSSSSSTTPMDKLQHQQWQTWRSAPGPARDLDLEADLDLDASDTESPTIKATPGFAPALFEHN
ncbi:MAG: hypothetical protein J3Q66DRAFT_388704 [Benniella sp.]|nr:MAG: hypothetical protein J3Q66DRAFT_388704 [Benniella sp.]